MYRTYLHPDDVFDEVLNTHVADSDVSLPLLNYVTKDDENFVYALCEAIAAGVNARHPEWNEG